jgi:hypothetical protein
MAIYAPAHNSAEVFRAGADFQAFDVAGRRLDGREEAG